MLPDVPSIRKTYGGRSRHDQVARSHGALLARRSGGSQNHFCRDFKLGSSAGTPVALHFVEQPPNETGAFRRFARSWLQARLQHERNPPKGSGVYRYPNTADANEATAVQIAAHSPSDNASTTVKAARLVSRSVTPCGDAPIVSTFGSGPSAV